MTPMQSSVPSPTLGHVSVHYMPGGDTTWLVLALIAAGRVRRAAAAVASCEARRGGRRRPALGIGGAGIVRPQIDPRTRPPASGPPTRLRPCSGCSITTPSSGSTWSGTAGAASSLLVARLAPSRVSRLPSSGLLSSSTRPRPERGSLDRPRLARATLGGSDIGGLVCGTMCLLRPAFARLAPLLEPDVPAGVAREGVQHSYPAYRDGPDSIWQDNPLPALLRGPQHPRASGRRRAGPDRAARGRLRPGPLARHRDRPGEGYACSALRPARDHRPAGDVRSDRSSSQ